MSETINLRTARKQRKRSADRAAAAAKAAASGEAGATRRLREANDALAATRLDRHRLDPRDPPADE